MKMLTIKTKNEKTIVDAPYHPDFIKKMQMQFMPPCDIMKHRWSVTPDRIPAVRKTMEEVFGESDIKAAGNRYDVQLTFLKDVKVPIDGLCFYGKCLAFALPQCREAMEGTGVCFAKGGFTFGQTEGERSIVVEKGTVVILYNVPEHLLYREKEPEGVAVKAIERTLDSLRSKLEKEIEERNRGDSRTYTLVPDISDEGYERDGHGKTLLEFLKDNSMATLSLLEDGHPRFCNTLGTIIKYWPIGTPIKDIIAELEANGWESHSGEENGVTDFYHAPTQIALLQHLQDYSQSFLRELYMYPSLDNDEIQPGPEIPGAQPAYIRFGELPKYGYSVNYACSLPEYGVSCYEAAITKNGDCHFVNLNTRLYSELASPLGGHLDSGLPVYRLYGDLVGCGSDGEPLLRVTKAEKFTGKCLKPAEPTN